MELKKLEMTDSKTHVCITIDTEGDAAINPNSTYLGIQLVLPKLIGIFDKFGIKATFFVQEDRICHAGALFPDSWKSLEKKGHEIGYHAHWTHPSPDEEKGAIITQGISYLRKNGLDIVSYRGGRFHLTGPLLHTLEKNGIKFDSSVVPGLRELFDDGTERCNHVGAPIAPYFPSTEDHTKLGESPILEIPINRYPRFHPGRWGGLLNGGTKDEILFDFFHHTRKDKIIIMILHIWEPLSILIRDTVRGDRYGKMKKMAYGSLKRFFSPERLINGSSLIRLENALEYLAETSDVRFTTLRQAGENWLKENRG